MRLNNILQQGRTIAFTIKPKKAHFFPIIFTQYPNFIIDLHTSPYHFMPSTLLTTFLISYFQNKESIFDP